MPNSESTLKSLVEALKVRAGELGFQECAITYPDASSESSHLKQWLERGYQGEMDYLANHFDKRLDPKKLIEGTQRIILVRMDYLPAKTPLGSILRDPDKAYIARYTLGRDYHKLIRARLKQLGNWLAEATGGRAQFRPFVDSAPVLERPLARQAGLGWIGKHTLLLNRHAGSWFFLGSLFTDIPLPVDQPEKENHCGRCSACMDVCPTQAFPEPWVLDARRCISYLTIEYRGSIPLELREKIGNRVFGCDDCQLICPWNRFASASRESDFSPRHSLDSAQLTELFMWDEVTFLKNTEGSAIRRTGYIGWLRNLAVALGNSNGGSHTIKALKLRADHSSELVREHVHWALTQLEQKVAAQPLRITNHPGAKRIPD